MFIETIIDIFGNTKEETGSLLPCKIVFSGTRRLFFMSFLFLSFFVEGFFFLDNSEAFAYSKSLLMGTTSCVGDITGKSGLCMLPTVCSPSDTEAADICSSTGPGPVCCTSSTSSGSSSSGSTSGGSTSSGSTGSGSTSSGSTGSGSSTSSGSTGSGSTSSGSTSSGGSTVITCDTNTYTLAQCQANCTGTWNSASATCSTSGGSTSSGSTGSGSTSSGSTGSGSTSSGGGGCPTNFEMKSGVCFPTPSTIGLSGISVYDFLVKLMNWLLGILGILGVIAFVISGTQYLVSAGDEEMAKTAKQNMTYAVIGLVVALAGLIVVNAIAGLTGAGGVTNY